MSGCIGLLVFGVLMFGFMVFLSVSVLAFFAFPIGVKIDEFMVRSENRGKE